MIVRTFTLAVFALASTAALAAAPAHTHAATLAETTTQIEARFGGEVTAIELDASGDKAGHYHVDLRYPGGGVARLDVDAASGDIVSRDFEPLPAGAPTLPEVASDVAAQLGGEVVAASLDLSEGARPHYDVDVRMPERRIARLKVDAQTRGIAWRTPAIVMP